MFIYICLENIGYLLWEIALMRRSLNFYLNLSNRLLCLVPDFVTKLSLDDILIYKRSNVGCQCRWKFSRSCSFSFIRSWMGFLLSSESMSIYFLKLRIWAYFYLRPGRSFLLSVLLFSCINLHSLFSNSEWYERTLNCSLNAKINIDLIFSILFLFFFFIYFLFMFYLFCFVLLLIVIVLCELIRCVTVYFLSKYTHLRLISFSIARAYSWRLISSIAWMIMAWWRVKFHSVGVRS